MRGKARGVSLRGKGETKKGGKARGVGVLMGK